MIKATELRIGNHVILGKEVRMVEGWMFIQECRNMTPVPITPEVLKKCGLDECADGNEYRIGLPLGNGTDLVIETLQEDSGPYDALISDTTADEVPKNYSYMKAQRYLHQLQNLYFAITGTELNYTQ